MKEPKRKQQHLHLMRTPWLIGICALIVIGGVMSFGFVGTALNLIHEGNAILMLAMIIPMALVAAAVSAITSSRIRKRMKKLLDAISSVARGDLDTQIDLASAGEYYPVYSDFNRMTKELKSTKAEMQNFINDFSHEFKTPIVSISGFSDYLIRTGGDLETPERLEYLQVIHEESTRLSNLAQNTLTLAKMEACQIIPDRRSYSLSDQLRHCIVTLMPAIEKREIEISLESEDVAYVGNPEFMEQVWLNLLNNAIRFTPQGGSIVVQAEEGDEEILVAIKDSGPGMSEEVAAHVFEKYYQGDVGRSVQGSGIGLSIVSRIVDLCEGTVCVDSAPGKGSTFKVTLPREEASASAARSRRPHPLYIRRTF